MDPFEYYESLKQQENSIKKCYFYYDLSTGVIDSMKMELDNDDPKPYIEVSEENLPEGIQNIFDFLIVEKDDKMELVKKQDSLIDIITVDDIIHQMFRIPHDPDIKISQANYSFDLLIEQDNIKQEFRIRVSDIIKSRYNISAASGQEMKFFVTAENDPNILYQTVGVLVTDLLKYKFVTFSYEEFEGIPCNIFSKRYFQNYIHIVIE